MAQVYRSSLERFNAPYRGITSRNDMVNFDLSTIHDIFHIQKVAGGNPSFDGHADSITGNTLGLRHGGDNIKASIPTAGMIVTSLGDVDNAQNMLDWTPLNHATVSKNNLDYVLKADGNFPAAGFFKIISVMDGDVIALRFRVEKGTGKGTKIAIGALNFDNDGDDLDFYQLDSFPSGKYIEKRLHCRSSQDIRIVVYVAYETSQGTPVEMSIRDFSVKYLTEVMVGVQGLESTVKTQLEIAEQTITFIERNARFAQGGTV